MRRRAADKRERLADPKFHSQLVTKLINMVMERGKKSTAETIVYGAFDIIKEKTKEEDPLEVLNKALTNARPALEVKSRRVGGATYQVPMEVRTDRGNALALRWIRDLARTRKGKPMMEKLAMEVIDAYKGEGSAIKKKQDLHKMAEANKAFSHYKW